MCSLDTLVDFLYLALPWAALSGVLALGFYNCYRITRLEQGRHLEKCPTKP